MAELYSVWLYNILLIQSSIDGHLDCLHLLATVNTQTFDTCICLNYI
jgi:hypothetical protein